MSTASERYESVRVEGAKTLGNQVEQMERDREAWLAGLQWGLDRMLNLTEDVVKGSPINDFLNLAAMGILARAKVGILL